MSHEKVKKPAKIKKYLFFFSKMCYNKGNVWKGESKMEKTICFTGHRHIPDEDYDALKELLYCELEKQIQNGATRFRTGGALGFDTLAALTVLLLKRRHPQIQLELILPCPTQTQGWKQSDVLLYEQILEQADRHRYVSQFYFAGVLQMRNRALVEGADGCIAYLCNSQGGGTAFTASLALKKGLEFVNLSEKLK